MTTTITVENLDRVLAFLPLFEDQNLKLYKFEPEASLFDPYCYSFEFLNFLNSLEQEGLTLSFNWAAWRAEAKHFVEDPSLLNAAPLPTLQQLLTTHICTEQFLADGYLAHLIDNGHFLAILKRLTSIRAGMILDQAWQSSQPETTPVAELATGPAISAISDHAARPKDSKLSKANQNRLRERFEQLITRSGES
ncbi:DUF6508 domain-containing protein [Leptolyngbya sp. FACHB-261]|uniref:DUF6508 domain-containing protein n=1 Tax=Leptolyngbya sp. FACHB-261 TaxID=2692806 RepID=UPI001687A653|nr:DUF6508 domain-containing protein [Leptolyngbya sp. FACHB-261]MBD2099295.1 hypothetical protein [Leptolyngbya sp. FACHB-261]